MSCARLTAAVLSTPILALASTAIGVQPTTKAIAASGASFRTEFPSVRMMGTMGQPQRIAAPNMAFGGSPNDTASNWLTQWGTVLHIDVDSVQLASPFPSGETQLGLMYDRANDTYKFTNVYFQQFAMGLPVHGSRLSVLCRNVPGYPAVQVAADLRDMRNFTPLNALPSIDESLASIAAVRTLGLGAVITTPELIVFAGNGEKA